tara:strand:+ start:1778 stop:2344 length:567 start_codon:yes stop_codon:yes gene_type:complete
VIIIELWFPRTQRSKSFYPWDNQEYFNLFDYEGLATYAILPEKIASDILRVRPFSSRYDSVLKRNYIFYDASTSKSYLIQPAKANNKQVIISEIIRTPKKVGLYAGSEYQVYFNSVLKPLVHPEASEFEIWTEYADISAVQGWINQQIKKPSETSNAHHAYYLTYDTKTLSRFNSVLNWTLFPTTILD